MAVMLGVKPASAIQLFAWKPALVGGDSISSYTLTPTTVAVEAAHTTDDEIQMFVSGGVAGNVYPIAASVETGLGETLKETLYVPVSGPGNGFTDTAQTVVDFALRPIVGISGTPTANERADALEWLNGMLAEWSAIGADVGAPLPLALADTIYANDSWVLGIKNNLRVLVAEQYGRQVAPATLGKAHRGLAIIKNARRSRDPVQAEYY